MEKSFSATEAIPDSNRGMPTLEDLPRYMVGPFHRSRLARTAIIYVIFMLAGAAPSLLARLGICQVSPALQCAAWGLYFPGAGLIATGRISGIIIGLIFILVSRTLGAMMLGMSGMILMTVWLWVISIAGAALLAQGDPPLYAWILIFLITAFIALKKLAKAKKTQKKWLKEREENEKYLPQAAQELLSKQTPADPQAERELSQEAVKAARFYFDMTLNRETGDFSGYDTAEQIQLSALRYSLDYIGYSLATMQCLCTPNFHGYLNTAQKFVIDSLTVPRVCSYWKFESFWGTFKWDPDPIHRLNIMFSGWSGILPVLYTSNSGDDCYEKEDALKFRPSKHRDKTYDYNNEGIVKAISSQWYSLKSKLIPCEPGMVFPWCNAWGFNTVLAYDRIHGTDMLEKAWPGLDERLKKDWTNANGKLAVAKNSVFGNLCSDMGGDFGAASSFSVSRVFNPTDPSLAAKEYILGKKDTFYEEDGQLKTYLGDWDSVSDIGNFKKGPGSLLGTSAVAAAELGDMEFARKLLEIADQTLERVDDEGCYYYKKASVTANANIALARFAQKDDLYNMIHHGPDENALKGPVLEKCSYPEVLVAKARSHTGEDLELVLYNGKEAGAQEIGIERLIPGQKYKISQTGETFKADKNGAAVFSIYINGRTPLWIERVSY